MKIKTIILVSAVILLTATGCERPLPSGIYLTEHKSFTVVSRNPLQYRDMAIDLDTVKLVDTPVISAEDVLDYDWDTHTLTVKPGIGRTLPRPDSFGIPFVLLAEGKRCYVGGIWTGASSVGTGRPVIDFDDAQDDTFAIRLGYPGPRSDTGVDPRNDARIKSVLSKLGKIKKAQPSSAGDFATRAAPEK